MMESYKKTYEAQLKKMKRVIIATASLLTASTIALISAISYDHKQNNENIKKNKVEIVSSVKHEEKEPTPYEKLELLRKVQVKTTMQYVKGVPYQYVDEDAVVKLSGRFGVAIEEYFKSCGASYWTNPDYEQFWPTDADLMVTAIAFKESSYRTDIMNDLGCGGLTGINKEKLLKTLGDEWLTSHIWGENVPQVNCNPQEVDIFNPATSIEYTYYNMGYNLANRFKKGKYFIDIDGQKRSVWDEIEYTEENQQRLLIASHLFGINNVVDSVFGRNYDKDGKLIKISEYLYCDYVEGVLDKMVELDYTHNSQLNY